MVAGGRKGKDDRKQNTLATLVEVSANAGPPQEVIKIIRIELREIS